MKKDKEAIHVPWQHRFIAGLFFQLELYSDRDIALYLQRESSFPKDGMAEAILRSFAKGMGKFPRAWKEILLKKCNESFIGRWRDDIFNSVLTQESSSDPVGKNSSTKKGPEPIEAKTPSTEKEPPLSLVEKVPEKITPPVEESDETSNITPQELTPEIPEVPQIIHSVEVADNQAETEVKEIKLLPESIVKMLTVSLSESLEKDGKLNPRKLVRALNTRSNNYDVKRKDREISFLGKRVTHKFTIPSDIELTAQ